MLTNRIGLIAAVVLALGGGHAASAQFGSAGFAGGGPGSAESALSSVETNQSVAIETPEKDGLKVYNIEEGTWSEYRAPKGARVRPIGLRNFIATMPEGENITQLAAYVEPKREWVIQDLREPVKGQLTPVISPGMAVYVVGRRVYAFGVQTAKWGILELPEGARPRPIVGGRLTTVQHGDRLYIFNARFGRWDDSGQPVK